MGWQDFPYPNLTSLLSVLPISGIIAGPGWGCLGLWNSPHHTVQGAWQEVELWQQHYYSVKGARKAVLLVPDTPIEQGAVLGICYFSADASCSLTAFPLSQPWKQLTTVPCLARSP